MNEWVRINSRLEINRYNLKVRQNFQEINPKIPIRRFDVFALFQAIRFEKQGASADDALACGYGLACAVASGSARPVSVKKSDGVKRWGGRKEQKYKEVRLPNGKIIKTIGSAEEFRARIIYRMGEKFYREVFEPIVRFLVEKGVRYEEMRDLLRESNGWDKVIRW